MMYITNGHKTNLIFNISSVTINKREMFESQIYDAIFADEIFPLPFNNSGKMLYSQSSTGDKFTNFKSYENLIMALDGKEWNMT